LFPRPSFLFARPRPHLQHSSARDASFLTARALGLHAAYPNKVAVETPAGDGDISLQSSRSLTATSLSWIPFPPTISRAARSRAWSARRQEMLLLLPAGIDVLDLKLKMVTDEYATVSPRADLEPQYFQAVLTSTDPLSVIAEVQPSIDADGVVDPHSIRWCTTKW